MTKLPLTLENSSNVSQKGVIIKIDSSYDQSNDGESNLLVKTVQRERNLIFKPELWDSTIKSDLGENVVSVEQNGEALNVEESKGTFSGAFVKASEEIKINKQKLALNFPPLWGLTSICGRRKEMEDSVVALPRFLRIPSWMCGDLSSIHQDLVAHVFGVYDGHGGCQVADYCQDRLHQVLAEEIGIAKENWHIEPDDCNWEEKWMKVFLNCFRKLTMKLEVSPVLMRILISKLLFHLLLPTRWGPPLWLPLFVLPISSLQIVVIREPSCDRYLRPYVVADPEVMFVPRAKEDECLILASDGLWDVMTNEEACELARRRILLWHKKNGPILSKERGEEIDPAAQDAADYLSRLAFQRGSRDNITVIVIDLKAQRKLKKKT
ncbi:hypothetical protein DH2020_026625 [Rehmannia glutinosa]|uniref:protein-serine/threonine phosphatase n=1 Tax=Rehmannia glutinosa TaxID=99300 RepID=A0ABR0VWE4_REHGL